MSSPASRFRTMRAFLCFSSDDEQALREFAPLVDDHVEEIIDDFYQRILADSDANAVLENPQRVTALKSQLRLWLRRLLAGPFDDEYYDLRARIGRRHVDVGLPQRFMPLAMNAIRFHLKRLATSSAAPARTLEAIDKALDLELTIMLEAYQEDARARLRTSERLSTIAQLAEAVSHELKNPIGVINANLLLLRDALDHCNGLQSDPEQLAATARRAMDRMRRASRAAADLGTQLIEYTRSKERGTQEVPLREVVEECLQSIEPGEVRVDTHIEPDDAVVRTQPADLSRVLANLLRNAVQAASRSAESPGQVRLSATRLAGSLIIEVTDNGAGVASELRERIFEPLFTTRASGTGLGLAISRDIVAAHEGVLEVEEAPGGGALFRVRLPQ